LMGGNNQNLAIVLERLRIFGNGPSECNGGITIARRNAGTLVVNSLIYANGRNGIATLDPDGGPHAAANNTIHDNGWGGICDTPPLVHHGVDPRIAVLYPYLSAVLEADFFGNAARPRAGTPTGLVKFDIGAVELQDTRAPVTTFLQPSPGAYLRQTVTVQAQATDNGSGISSVALTADARALVAHSGP